MTDPLRRFEHSHAALSKLALEIRDIVRGRPSEGPGGATVHDRLVALLATLTEELLHHFSHEEEGLFPFVQRIVPAKAEVVTRLADAHDTICGALLRLAHVVESDENALGASHPALLNQYERFENAYAAHSHAESELFEELDRTLDEHQRAELGELLRGL